MNYRDICQTCGQMLNLHIDSKCIGAEIVKWASSNSIDITKEQLILSLEDAQKEITRLRAAMQLAIDDHTHSDDCSKIDRWSSDCDCYKKTLEEALK